MEEIKILNEIGDVLADASVSDHEAETRTENASSHRSIKPKELSKEEENWWEKLKLLQCPFNWDDLHEIEIQDRATEKGKCRISRIEEKMKEIDEYDTFEYRKFILSIVLVYEHFHYGDTGSVMAVLRETEALVASSSKSVGSLSKLIADINDALYHVVLACRAYVQLNSHVLSDVECTFAKIILFDDMNNKCKAAISGIRAATLMEYGYNGNIGAMKHIETALSLDPDQGEWHFLLGKCMGRMRRMDATFQMPSKKELNSLEEAVKLTKNVSYIVFLAQAYREATFRGYSEQRHNTTSANATRTLQKMNKQSLELYKEAMKLGSGCPDVIVRCAQGFMKLPHPYKDLALAKKCLEEALKYAPNNPMVNHTAAVFYERHENNFSEAKKYYERASQLGAFGSYMDLIRVRYNENKFDYDPIPDLEISIEKKFREHLYQQEATMQMGSYYLFVKDDIENAFKYWEKVINEDPESKKLKMHKCLFLHMLKPVNVYEVLCDESRLALQQKSYKAKENESMYRQIIMKCTKNYPVCATTSPIRRRKMVMEEVEEVKRSRFCSKSRVRGRGGFHRLGGLGRGQRGGERERR